MGLGLDFKGLISEGVVSVSNGQVLVSVSNDEVLVLVSVSNDEAETPSLVSTQPILKQMTWLLQNLLRVWYSNEDKKYVFPNLKICNINLYIGVRKGCM